MKKLFYILPILFTLSCGVPNQIDFDSVRNSNEYAAKKDKKDKEPKGDPGSQSPGDTDTGNPGDPTLPPGDDNVEQPADSFSSAIPNIILSEIPCNSELPEHQNVFNDVGGKNIYSCFVVDLPVGAYKLIADYYIPAGYLYRRDDIKFILGDYVGPIQGYPSEYVDAVLYPEGWVVSYTLPILDGISDPTFYGQWYLDAYIYGTDNSNSSVYFEMVE